MRNLLHFAVPSALSAALLLGPVPVVSCQEARSCPMLAAHAAAGAGEHCDPGPSLDCCVDHRTPPAEDSAPAGGGQLAGAAAAVPAPAAVAAPAPPPRLPQASSAPRRGDDPVPLYTLHAALLI
jgi:hypothetical protein